jgi:gas vesicle protein
MSEKNSGDKVLYLLAGAGIGAVLALLFAPKTGRETRELIARTANDGRDFLSNKAAEGRSYIEGTGRKVTDEFSSFIEKSKDALQRQKEQVAAAFEAGKAAYNEERGIPE